MNVRQGPSIKQKLTSIIIITSCIAVLLACVAFILYDRVTFKHRLVTNVKTIARIIGENSTAAISFGDTTDASHLLASLKVEQDVLKACIYDSNKTVFAVYPATLDRSAFLNINSLKSDIQFHSGSIHLFQLIHDEKSNNPIGVVYIQYSLRVIDSRLKKYIQIASLFVLVAIFIVSAISLKLQHIISNPILHLATVARDVSQKKDFSIRAHRFSSDELGFLTDRFNEMLDQIQERDLALQKTYDELKQKAQELEVELWERRQAEQQLKRSLDEKEVLVREIHHRVKNNLQIISSLIYLQTKNITDPAALRLFRDGDNRVRSMALIHEELYNSKDLAHIDFAAYIKNLTNHLYHSYREENKVVHIKTDVDKISLSMDTAINCGMIINELVSNSLKHAFTKGQAGTIRISLHPTNRTKYLLIVSDDGKGIPSHIDFLNTQSLGLQLVCNLTDQINGTIELNRENGTEFRIAFMELK